MIVRVMGGLGNQMFQYAFGLGLQEKFGCIVKFDHTWFTQTQGQEFKRESGKNLFAGNFSDARASEIDGARGLSRYGRIWAHLPAKIKDLFNIEYQEKSSDFDSEVFAGAPHRIYSGYWQSEQYFSHVEKSVRDHFLWRHPLPDSVTSLTRELSSPISVAVHVRRGDYLKNPEALAFHGIISENWYQAALQKMRESVPGAQFWFFSDEPEVLRNGWQLGPDCNVVELASDIPDYVSMSLMSNASHNIIANSTFSWWAAWLNRNPEKHIIAPEKWFNGRPYQKADRFPDTWVLL